MRDTRLNSSITAQIKCLEMKTFSALSFELMMRLLLSTRDGKTYVTICTVLVRQQFLSVYRYRVTAFFRNPYWLNFFGYCNLHFKNSQGKKIAITIIVGLLTSLGWFGLVWLFWLGFENLFSSVFFFIFSHNYSQNSHNIK